MSPSTDREALGSLLFDFWRDAQLPADRLDYLAFQSRRYPSILDFLAPFGPFGERRALDLGGGVGSLAVAVHARLGGRFEVADYFAATGPHAQALERRGVAAAWRCDLTAPDPLAEKPGDYDLVLFVEVLEHLLVNPLLLFRAIYDHMRPGGLLFLTTPNQARLSNRWKLLIGRSIKEPGRYPTTPNAVLGHVVEYSRAELDQLLAAEGFQRVRTAVIQQRPGPGASSLQRLGIRMLNGWVGRRFELGDDILGLYRKAERPAPGSIGDRV